MITVTTRASPNRALKSKVRFFDAKWLIGGAAALIALWLALVPLIFLVWQSFMTPQTVGEPGEFTLANYRAVYGSAKTLGLLGNSVAFAGGASAIAVLIGTLLAWINERTNTPFKPLFYALGVVPLIIPGILFVTAWIMLASPRIGLLNLMLQQALGTDAVFFNIYTLAGMMWVDGIQHAPIAFLLMSAAFRATNPALEEAALMSGASLPAMTWNVTLRLCRPALAASFLILFLRSIESFENPALLGLPVGIEVFTSSIYDALRAYPSDAGLAATYAIALLIITSGGTYWQSLFSRDGRRYATIAGKDFRHRSLDTGAWRYVFAGAFFLYALLVIGLPFLVLFWASLQPFYSAPSWSALHTVSFANYRAVFEYPGIGRAVANSAFLALTSAMLTMVLAAVLAWTILRTRIPGRSLLDNIASLPMVIPGLVMGLALMVSYLELPFAIYGTIWILLIAYLTRFLPYGIRFSTAALTQIHSELEESSALSGADWASTFRRIVLPLLRPGLMAGGLYIAVVSLRELSSSILLYSPGSEVVSVVLWELWQNGQYVQLSALGVMLIAVLFVFVALTQIFSRRSGMRQL